MKLTKKQKEEMFNCHNGVGFIVVKRSDNTLSYLMFFANGEKEVCLINDSMPADKINLNEWVTKPF